MVVHVRPGTVHRVEGLEESEFVEVSTPELDDVVRLADDFGRPERDAR
jgi:quercetin dioxygenase-like cupin family protein